MPRDYTPSKQFNSKLSLETHKQIEALRSPELPTQRAVIERAIAALHEASQGRGLTDFLETQKRVNEAVGTEAPPPVDYGTTKGDTLRAAKVDKETVRTSDFARTIRHKGDNKR